MKNLDKIETLSFAKLLLDYSIYESDTMSEILEEDIAEKCRLILKQLKNSKYDKK